MLLLNKGVTCFHHKVAAKHSPLPGSAIPASAAAVPGKARSPDDPHFYPSSCTGGDRAKEGHRTIQGHMIMQWKSCSPDSRTQVQCHGLGDAHSLSEILATFSKLVPSSLVLGNLSAAGKCVHFSGPLMPSFLTGPI